MTLGSQAARELDALESIQASLAAIADRTDPGRRHELVALRRQLSAQIAIVGEMGTSLFAQNAERLAEYRRLCSAMRSATALHQAEWPAVRLGEDDDSYRQSAVRARQANGTFASWLRAELQEQPPLGDRT